MKSLVVVVLAVACSGGSGGGSGDPDGGSGGGSGGGGGGCRFSTASCSTCISTSCGAEADACYGAGYAPGDLCADSGAAAACHASSASEGLKLQTAYGKCVLAQCTSQCK
ncbi:MAG: hypothetical protein IT377_13005 [Polyangiaceae bacterium]|nr:hypothetical protein [Polyangiaceae bacterium]